MTGQFLRGPAKVRHSAQFSFRDHAVPVGVGQLQYFGGRLLGVDLGPFDRVFAAASGNEQQNRRQTAYWPNAAVYHIAAVLFETHQSTFSTPRNG